MEMINDIDKGFENKKKKAFCVETIPNIYTMMIDGTST